MNKQTVRTPAIINIAFLSLLLIPVIFFIIGRVSANNLEYCDKQFADGWFQQISPEIQKQCGNRFIWNTNRIKRQFILNHK